MSKLSATVGWFFSSLMFGLCAVCGSTPQQHILSLSVRSDERSWLMRAEIDCNRLARRRASCLLTREESIDAFRC